MATLGRPRSCFPSAMNEPKRRPILLIEDDPLIQAATNALLVANGYTVAVAGDGEEALHHLRQGVRPVLILLDLRMPIMDGARFRSEQMADAALRSIPVVVLSGDGAARRSAVFDGVAHYRKPLDEDELLSIVAQYASSGPSAASQSWGEAVRMRFAERQRAPNLPDAEK